jgi:hypothetical protein
VISRVVEAFQGSEDIKVLYGIQDFIDPQTGRVLLVWGRQEEPSTIKRRMYLPHPTVFCRKEVYDKVGLFRKDYRYAMDYEWALRVVKFTRPYFLNYKLACMRDMGHSGKHYKGSLAETTRALWEHGHYWAWLQMKLRNAVKILLTELGLKRLIFWLWQRNVGPAKHL